LVVAPSSPLELALARSPDSSRQEQPEHSAAAHIVAVQQLQVLAPYSPLDEAQASAVIEEAQQVEQMLVSLLTLLPGAAL
jgi:hypothetical protein